MTDRGRSTTEPDDDARSGGGHRDPPDVPADADTTARPRRRRPRRAVRPATDPQADDSPDLAEVTDAPPVREVARDRWLREQRPPHWE